MSSRRWWPPCGHSPYGIELKGYHTHWWCGRCEVSIPVKSKGKMLDPWGEWIYYEAQCPCSSGFRFSTGITVNKIVDAWCVICEVTYDIRYDASPQKTNPGGGCSCEMDSLMRYGCKCGGK